MRVRDTGAGIPAANVPFIFEKFFQADNQASASMKGTGLGLAIAKSIVTAHGGSISVESKVGSGTTFAILAANEGEWGATPRVGLPARPRARHPRRVDRLPELSAS